MTFHLPDNHREDPPPPTRRQFMLRKLTNSTSLQRKIDATDRLPVHVVDNRPGYLRDTQGILPCRNHPLSLRRPLRKETRSLYNQHISQQRALHRQGHQVAGDRAPCQTLQTWKQMRKRRYKRDVPRPGALKTTRTACGLHFVLAM